MIFIALILESAGLLLIYKSWRKPQRRVVENSIAWLMVLVSIWPWQDAVGLEFGICFWFLAMPVISWVLVVINREYRKMDAPIQPRNWVWPARAQVVQNIVNLVIAGPIAFMACYVCATGLGMATGYALGLVEVNQMLLGFILFLLLWPVVIYRISTKAMRWQSASGLLLVALGGPAVLYGFSLYGFNL
ncbi:MAG: hypothetical protein KUG72_08980 [Pseudomonadales bacterium]|nr:hypothetical protein [Pseudomonadales bacterium]